MKNIFSLFLATLLVFSSCGDSNEVRQFDFEKEGGTRFTLQIEIQNFILGSLNDYTDPELRKLLDKPCDAAPLDCIDQFCDNADAMDYNISKYFHIANPDEFEEGPSNEEMKSLLKGKYQLATENCMKALKSRLDHTESVYNLYKNDQMQTIVESHPEANANMVARIIQSYLKVGFYNCLAGVEGFNCIQSLEEDLIKRTNTDTIELDQYTSTTLNEEIKASQHPIKYYLSQRLTPKSSGEPLDQTDAKVGYAKSTDTSYLNNILLDEKNKKYFPEGVHFAWGHLNSEKFDDMLALYMLLKPEKSMCIKSNDIEFAEAQERDYQWNILINFTDTGAKKWAKLTEKNIGKPIAIFFDSYVVSCPIVQQKMDSGEAMIHGLFTEEEAKELASIIDYSSMPYPLTIISSEQH